MLQRLQSIVLAVAFIVTGVLMVFIIVGWLGEVYPATVVEERRDLQHGYSVEKYRWQDKGFTVRMRTPSSEGMRYDVPALPLDRVKLRKWLPGDRAVMIEVAAGPGDVLFLYDFRRDAMHSCGVGTAWREWPTERRRTPFDTCTQLHDYAQSLLVTEVQPSTEGSIAK